MCMCFQCVGFYAEFAVLETKLNKIFVPILRGWVSRLKLVKTGDTWKWPKIRYLQSKISKTSEGGPTINFRPNKPPQAISWVPPGPTGVPHLFLQKKWSKMEFFCAPIQHTVLYIEILEVNSIRFIQCFLTL